jgi:HK97 family phage major capsid protein
VTLEELMAQARAAVNARLAERAKAVDAVRALASDTTATDEKVDVAISARKAADAALDEARTKLDELEAEQKREAEVVELQKRVGGTRERPAYDEVIRHGNVTEERTYTAQKAKRENLSFFSDAYNARERDDYTARERLSRHSKEAEVHGEIKERALATGGAAGLVVPQYLVDMAAPVLRNGRATANICNQHELPAQGMSLIVPRGTTGASSGPQATENAAVSNTDQVWANLTVPVVTVAGQENVSRQLLERGAGMDEIIYTDLLKAYAANLDTQVINGSGSGGNALGILQTAGKGASTAFGAAPSITNAGLKVAGGIQSVFGQGAGILARVLVMAPRRWGWYLAQVDSTGRPVVIANAVGNFNSVAVVNDPGADSADPATLFVGTHSSGLPILVDPNVPTNIGTNVEDVIIVGDNHEWHLWEDGAPTELRFEQTPNSASGVQLTTTLAIYGYAAFTAGRYPGASYQVGGADSTATFGFVAPTF